MPLKIIGSARVFRGLGGMALPTAQCDALLSGKSVVGRATPVINYDNDGQSVDE